MCFKSFCFGINDLENVDSTIKINEKSNHTYLHHFHVLKAIQLTTITKAHKGLYLEPQWRKQHNKTLRPCLVLGVILLSTTEVSVPPRLLLAFNAGEGGSAEKVEWV